MVVKNLLLRRIKSGGRNFKGSLVIRGRGGGFKQKTRVVDIYQDLFEIRGKILSIRYDPTRNAKIGFIFYDIGCVSLSLLPNLIKENDYILSSSLKKLKVKPGNSMPLKNIPLGTSVFNIEVFRGDGGRYVRSAGTRAVLFQRFFKFSGLLLPSGKVKYFRNDCIACVGTVNNVNHLNVNFQKAGYFRRKGFKSKVRGVAMNTCDHIHGGGHSISASYNKKVLKFKKTRSKYKIKLFKNFQRKLRQI